MSANNGGPMMKELEPSEAPLSYGNEESWAYLHGYNAAVERANARIAELTAEVDRLRILVREAYEEGARDGSEEAASAERGHGDRFADFETSDARNALREGK